MCEGGQGFCNNIAVEEEIEKPDLIDAVEIERERMLFDKCQDGLFGDEPGVMKPIGPSMMNVEFSIFNPLVNGVWRSSEAGPEIFEGVAVSKSTAEVKLSTFMRNGRDRAVQPFG